MKRATVERERVLDTETTPGKIKRMSECEARVLAMLIDCKGRIHGAQTTEGTIKVPYRKPDVEVTMKSILPVVCASVWCGRFGVIGKDGKRLSIWAIGSSYIWEIGTEEETRQLLKKIRPYVYEKKEQVKTALDMLAVLEEKDGGFEEETQKLANKLTELNRRQQSNVPRSLRNRLKDARKLQKSEAALIILKWLDAQLQLDRNAGK